MKKLIFLPLIILLSCNKTTTGSNIKTGEKTPLQQNASTAEFNFDKEKTFGVYRITEKDFAIVQNVQFDNPNFPLSKDYEAFFRTGDSLEMPWLYGKPMKDGYKYVDTIINPNLIYNPRFEKEFLPKMKSEYFVYGKNGTAKAKIKKVIFQSTDCGSDYIAYLLDLDTAKTGTPLIATETELPLNFGKNYSKQNPKFFEFAKKDATETMYGLENVYHPKIFADFGGRYFFAYHDDFYGYDVKSPKGKVQFPERAVFAMDKDGKIKMFWQDEMDLLGLPCL